MRQGIDSLELELIRKQFPVTEEYAYLRYASTGPPSLQTVSAAQQCMADLQRSGMVAKANLYEQVEKVRGLAASLIGAEPAEIAFTSNTTHGLLIVAGSIAWREGDNVVTAETEFRGNVYPWLELRRLGVQTRFAPSHRGRISVEGLEGLIDERTRLVALSWVEVWTGFRNDLQAIGRMCREKGALFCVDAIQGLGALRLDVRDSYVDFMSSGGHKWLLTPLGVGFFYCRKELLGQIIPALVGWRSYERGHPTPLEAPLLPDCRRFEGGNPNLPGILGLGKSLQFFLDVGRSRIEDRVKGLTDHLIQGLLERGYPLVSPAASWSERSGIVTFDHERHDSSDLHNRLNDARVVVAKSYLPDSPGLRVSPHFFNTEAELDRLLHALP